MEEGYGYTLALKLQDISELLKSTHLFDLAANDLSIVYKA